MSFKAVFETEGDAITRIALSPSPKPTYEIQGPQLPAIGHWFADYLSGGASSVSLPLDLSKLPPFHQKVLKALMNVPFGKTITYGDLAQAAGSPKGARAVGSACNRNPFPLAIPCHRVVSASGPGGFAYGLDLKKAILSHENIDIQ